MKILHLYYDLMNLYGDYGNLEVLKKHLEDQGIGVFIDKKRSCVNVNFNDYDLIYIGSGTENAKEKVLKDLTIKKDELIKVIEEGKIILFTGNAMELVSKENLNILKLSAVETNNRYTGDVIVRNDDMGEIIGFINKCSIITNDDISPLFNIEYADTNLGNINSEGYRYKNLFGTHIIGPILVSNPKMLEYLIKLIMAHIGIENGYKDIDYEYERLSHEVSLNELKNRANNKK